MTLKSGLEITQVIETSTIRKLESLVVVSYSPSRPNCGSIWHYFQDKARYLSKIVIFYTLLHWTPPLGGLRRSIAIPFGIREN